MRFTVPMMPSPCLSAGSWGNRLLCGEPLCSLGSLLPPRLARGRVSRMGALSSVGAAADTGPPESPEPLGPARPSPRLCLGRLVAPACLCLCFLSSWPLFPPCHLGCSGEHRPCPRASRRARPGAFGLPSPGCPISQVMGSLVSKFSVALTCRRLPGLRFPERPTEPPEEKQLDRGAERLPLPALPPV